MTGPHRSWRARLAMTLVFASNGVAFGAWAANIPRLREQAGLSDAALGVVLLFVSFGAVLAMPLVGGFADRVGTGRACAVAGLVLGLALPVPALATGSGLPVLAGSAVLLGLGLGMLDVSMNAHAAAFEQRWDAPIMSSMHAGWSMGELAGAAVGGVLAGLAVPLGWALAASSPFIVAAAAGALWVPVPKAVPHSGPRFALPSRALAGICILAGLSFAIEGTVADWSGVYLRTDLGAPAALAASSLGTFAAVMVVCRIFGDYAVHWLGRKRIVRLGSVLAAAGMVGAVLSPNLYAASACFALVGIGVANTVPVLFSAAGQRGAAGVAAMATVGYGAAMAAPPILGFIANEIGLRASLTLIAGVAACIAVLAGFAANGPDSDQPAA